ncbi:MAG: PrsW family intramembrane metalloprotease [Euryarchaeota archaeon]|nr:PrsW family intramembrane metalloprotease [Euryarchaeota archaeon]
MIIVRNTERYRREPWRAVLRSFFWGASGGVIIAAILEIILVHFYTQSFEFLRGYEFIAEHKESIDAIILAAVIAPFVEEATKAYGVITSKRYIDEVEDGLVYGASSGFGFAATENLLYEVSALLTGGIASWIAVSAIRSLASALLHGSATSMTGLGYSSKRIAGRGSMLHGYGIAVAMHSSFNIIASIPILFAAQGNPIVYLVPLVLALLYGTIAFHHLRNKIRYFDRRSRP